MLTLGISLDCDQFLKTQFDGEHPNHQLVESLKRLPPIQKPIPFQSPPPQLSHEQVQEYIESLLDLPIERMISREFLTKRDNSFSNTIGSLRQVARVIKVEYGGSNHPISETIRAFRALCRIQATFALSPFTLPRICEYLTLNYAASLFATLLNNPQINSDHYQEIRYAVDELVDKSGFEEMLLGEIGICYFRMFTSLPRDEYKASIKILPPSRKFSKIHVAIFLKSNAPKLAAPLEVGYLNRYIRALQSLRSRRSEFGLSDLIRAFEPVENPLSLYKGLCNDRETFVAFFQAYETEGLRRMMKEWMALTMDRFEGMSTSNSVLNAEHAEIMIRPNESVLTVKSYRNKGQVHRVQLPDWR